MSRRHLCRFVAIGCLMCVAGRSMAADLTFSNQTTPANVSFLHSPSLLFETSVSIVSYMTAGGTCGDFNRDGYQDLYVLGGGVASDALFINNGDGTFTNRTVEWGVDEKHMSVGIAVGDYDNDGWLDVFITNYGPNGELPKPHKHLLYRNLEGKGFADVAAAAGVETTSPTKPDGMGAAFGDYDLDGDLDLYVAGWLKNAGGNLLFRNNGNGTFTNVTNASGLSAPIMRGFSPTFADMDGDFYPELLIAADFGTSRYYINNKDGTFTFANATAGTGLEGNGMGSCIADVSGDGLPDWYVTSIFTPQPQGGIPGTGNMLYINQGRNVFIEQGGAAGVKDGGWGWGAVAVDLDHDGRVDLTEVNGWPFDDEFINENCKLFLQQRPGSYAEIATSCGFVNAKQGRGVFNLDYDSDGDQDIVVDSYKDTLMLLRNDLSGPSRNWIRVFLDTSGNNRLAPDGYGARIRILANGSMQTRQILGGSRYLSQGELSAHFGLGGSDLVDLLRVDWPDGTSIELPHVPANQTLTIYATDLCDLDADTRVNGADLGHLLSRWGEEGPIGDLNADHIVDELDMALLLKHWTG